MMDRYLSTYLPATAVGAYRAARSWMKPTGAAQKLLYVTDSGSATVKVYTYPDLSYTGELAGFVLPLFDCADKSGDVWVSDYGSSGTLYEYAHGGTTPINELTGLSYPYSCAVIPKRRSCRCREHRDELNPLGRSCRLPSRLRSAEHPYR